MRKDFSSLSVVVKKAFSFGTSYVFHKYMMCHEYYMDYFVDEGIMTSLLKGMSAMARTGSFPRSCQET